MPEDALNSRTEKQTGLYIALSEARKDADTQATFADSCAEQAGKAEADAAAAQERIAALTESRTGYRREQEENRRLYADGEQRLAALSADQEPCGCGQCAVRIAPDSPPGADQPQV